MKPVWKTRKHPVSVIAMVAVTVWTAAAVGAAWAVLVNWYGTVLLGGFPLPGAG